MPKMTPDEKKALVASAQGGCKESQQALYELYSRLVYKLAWSFAGDLDQDKFESASHLGFVDALRIFDASRGFTFTTLLYKCCSNRLLRTRKDHYKHLTRYGNRLRCEDDGTLSPIDDYRSSCIDSELLRDEREKILYEAIRVLPERQQDILIDRMDGLKLREISKRMGITRQRVAQLEIKGKSAIREYFQIHYPEFL